MLMTSLMMDILFDLDYQKIIFYLSLCIVDLPNLKIMIFIFSRLWVVMVLLLIFISSCRIDSGFICCLPGRLVSWASHLCLSCFRSLVLGRISYYNLLFLFIFPSSRYFYFMALISGALVSFHIWELDRETENHS